MIRMTMSFIEQFIISRLGFYIPNIHRLTLENLGKTYVSKVKNNESTIINNLKAKRQFKEIQINI